MEIWKPVPDYEKHYEVSNRGRFRRISRAPATRPGKVLKLGNVRGYRNVTFSVGNIQHTYISHRVIWRAFFGDIPETVQINHINGNKADNRLSNLEVCTAQENYHHALHVLKIDRKLKPGSLRGMKNPNRTIDEAKAKEIRRLYESGKLSQQAIANQFGIHQTQVSRIIARLGWAHV